ncbi:MAG: hypothetical protein ACXWL2_04355 [Candidatus Chromulinivorax sp.]
MKKLYLVIPFIFMDFILQPASFKYSAEEELEKELEYFQRIYPDKTKDDIFDELQTHFASNIYKSMPILEVIKILKQSSNTQEDKVLEASENIADMFEALKIKMNIPTEVELWYTNGLKDSSLNQSQEFLEDALYDAHERRVYISIFFWGRTPATRQHRLIHELIHVQQHQKLGLRRLKEISAYAKEHEADNRSIMAIKCPVCTQLIADELSTNYIQNIVRSELGYLSKEDIELDRMSKKNDDICLAHNANTPEAQELRKLVNLQTKESLLDSVYGLFKDKSLERLNLDWKCSQKARDRLSTVKF